MKRYHLPVLALGLLWLAGVTIACGSSETGLPPTRFATVDTGLLTVGPPPFTPGIFPCSRCHARLITNPTWRKLVWAHTEIELRHNEKNRWCLDCHSVEDRDRLHLASGQLIEFAESYRLCGQCHGTKRRDWEAGEHGKRLGSWSGKKEYLLCASCHDPHHPRFAPMAPLPPPALPEELGVSR